MTPNISDGPADVEDLITAGRLVEAVDRLAAAPRPTGADAVRLVDLRRQAALEDAPGPGREPWPPAYPDPFPGLSGRPPEIGIAELDAEVLGGAVAHHGCLLVRGAYDAARTARMVAAIDQARAAASLSDGGEASTDDDVVRWYRPMHAPPALENHVLRKMVADQGGIWLGDSPDGTERVLADLAEVGILGAITEHLGERPYFSLQKSTMRRSMPEYRLAGWHQDGSFLSADVRTMNAWVALSPCGGDRPAPGLEVIPRRLPEVLPVAGELTPHSISFDLIDEITQEMPTLVPQFDAGDALLFDERFVHRSHLTPEMTDVRYAIECWLFAPSHRFTGYVPLLA